MMRSRSSQKLRTKTGCLTCRQRRRKCDEGRPVCRVCCVGKRECKWPTSADLLDRRFLSHAQSRHKPHEHQAQEDQPESRDDTTWAITENRDGVFRPALRQMLEFLPIEASMAQGVMTRDLELVVSKHFFDNYYGLLILPGCHPDFFNGWLTEIMLLMTPHEAMYDAVLACAASHLYYSENCSRMRELALTYYSQAITKLSRLLAITVDPQDHDGTLMAVMLLYIHGVMGWGTYSDITRHLKAAIGIVDAQVLKRPVGADLATDILVIESILYHIFHVSTGLWSDIRGPDFDFDLDFWVRAESRLDQESLVPGEARSCNSPVLGVPVSLMRLALLLRQQCQQSFVVDLDHIQSMENEVAVWERTLLRDSDAGATSADLIDHQKDLCRDASSLYAIIVSLLLTQTPRKEPGPPLEVPSSDWRIQRALAIVTKYASDDGWAKCFIGNWPTYTLGFFMSRPRDREVIRSDLERRWKLTKMAQVLRFRNDLESIWASRHEHGLLLQAD